MIDYFIAVHMKSKLKEKVINIVESITLISMLFILNYYVFSLLVNYPADQSRYAELISLGTLLPILGFVFWSNPQVENNRNHTIMTFVFTLVLTLGVISSIDRSDGTVLIARNPMLIGSGIILLHSIYAFISLLEEIGIPIVSKLGELKVWFESGDDISEIGVRMILLFGGLFIMILFFHYFIAPIISQTIPFHRFR